MVKIPPDFSIPESCIELVEQLARTVYAHGNDNQKGQAMLCTVYFRYVLCWRVPRVSESMLTFCELRSQCALTLRLQVLLP